MTQVRITRRAALVGAAAALAAACAPAAAPGVTAQSAAPTSAPTKAIRKLGIGVGTLSFSTMQQAFRYYDEKNNIINRVGKDFGYDLDVKWLEFPVAPEEFAAFQSGDVVIGPMATFPLIGQLKKGEPYRVLTNSLGMFPFMLMVKKGGGITDLDQIKGQTVGLALGTAHQFVFENFVFAKTGKTSKDFGLTLASQPIPIPTMPRGLAAYQTFSPAILPALAKPDSEIEPLFQLSAPPQTGPAYNGPLGKGAGIAIPEAKKSPWFPEGFIALRNLFVVRDPFLKEHPDVVKSFVIAQQKVIRELAGLKPSQITDLFPASTWEGMPRKAYEEKAIATDLLYKQRNWIWPGEDVVKVLLGESQQMVKIGVIKEPLGIAEVKAAFEPTMPILKAAFEATGSYPDDKTFTDPQAQDLRGLPVWKLDLDKFKGFDVYK